MNPLTLGGSSGPSLETPKRKRGRPRKDTTLKSPEAQTSAGVGSFPPKSRLAPTLLGREVTGIIEADFSSGYLLSVKIGNSTMKGVVFKREHRLPVTPENDVTPHLPLITPSTAPKKRGRKPKVAQTCPEKVVNAQISEADIEVVEPLLMLQLEETKIDGEVRVSEEVISITQGEMEQMLTTEAHGKNESSIHDGQQAVVMKCGI